MQNENRWIRSQKIRESCGIEPIPGWVGRRRKRRKRGEWNEPVTRMDAKRLVKISRDNVPAIRRSLERPKRSRKYLSLTERGGIAYKKEEEEKQ